MNLQDQKERMEGRAFGPTHADLHAQAEGHSASGRPLGSPLPAGNGGHSFRSTPPPGRALSTQPEEAAGMQRAMGILKQAMPFVQKLLPLVDGNIASLVASLLSTRHHTPPAPTVDLSPVQNQVAELHLQQLDLRTHVVEQHASLKRVEDQLEQVREATDRNTLEQQELIEDLKAVGNKVNLFAMLLFLLLTISVLLNLILFLHMKQVLP